MLGQQSMHLRLPRSFIKIVNCFHSGSPLIIVLPMRCSAMRSSFAWNLEVMQLRRFQCWRKLAENNLDREHKHFGGTWPSKGTRRRWRWTVRVTVHCSPFRQCRKDEDCFEVRPMCEWQFESGLNRFQNQSTIKSEGQNRTCEKSEPNWFPKSWLTIWGRIEFWFFVTIWAVLETSQISWNAWSLLMKTNFSFWVRSGNETIKLRRVLSWISSSKESFFDSKGVVHKEFLPVQPLLQRLRNIAAFERRALMTGSFITKLLRAMPRYLWYSWRKRRSQPPTRPRTSGLFLVSSAQVVHQRTTLWKHRQRSWRPFWRTSASKTSWQASRHGRAVRNNVLMSKGVILKTCIDIFEWKCFVEKSHYLPDKPCKSVEQRMIVTKSRILI